MTTMTFRRTSKPGASPLTQAFYDELEDSWLPVPRRTPSASLTTAAVSQGLLAKIDAQFEEVGLIAEHLAQGDRRSVGLDTWVDAPASADYQAAYTWTPIEVDVIAATDRPRAEDSDDIWHG